MLENILENQIDINGPSTPGISGPGGPSGPTSPPTNGGEGGSNGSVPTYSSGQFVTIKVDSEPDNLVVYEDGVEIATTPQQFTRTFEQLLGTGLRYEIRGNNVQPTNYYRVSTIWETSDRQIQVEDGTEFNGEPVDTLELAVPYVLVEEFDANGIRTGDTQYRQITDFIVTLDFDVEPIEVEPDPEIEGGTIFVQTVTSDERILGTEDDRSNLANIIFTDENIEIEETDEGFFISNIPFSIDGEIKIGINDDRFVINAFKFYPSNGERDYEVVGELSGILQDTQEYRTSLAGDDVFIEIEYQLQPDAPVVNPPEVSLITPVIQFDYSNQGDVTFSVSKQNATGVRAIDWKGNEYDVEFQNNQFGRVVIPREVVTGIGQRTVRVIPFDEFRDGIYAEQVINITDTTGVLDPRFTEINYPSLIRGNDYEGYDVDFSLSFTTINTDYVNVYIGNEFQPYGNFSSNKTLNLNVQQLINQFGIGTGDEQTFEFDIRLTPSGPRGEGQSETLTITFDKSAVQLPTELVEQKLEEAFLDGINLDDFSIENEKYLTHIANFDNEDFKVISNWDRDDVTFTEFTEDELGNEIPVDGEVNSSLILKLFEPLPRSIQPNTQLWISKLKATPFIDRVTLREESEDVCVKLRPPNFEIDPTRGSVGYEMYDEIITTGSETSEDLVRKYVTKRGLNDVKLQINYYDEDTSSLLFENFIHFSSAEEQLLNYDYKVKLINAYEERLDFLSTISTKSIAESQERDRIQNNINTTIGNFTGFEQTLYNDLSLTDSTTTQYINTLDQFISDAVEYDRYNDNSLVSENNIPSYILQDDESESFIMFLKMIGQHFDVIWSYINGLKQTNIVEHKKEDGIIDDLVYEMLGSFGWDADSSSASQRLWVNAFGSGRDNELLPGTGVDELSISQDTSLYASGEDYQNEIWRRILNNLPYLLKQKGTKRSLSAILSIYGVPNSMLSIVEFGGPVEEGSDNTASVTLEDQTSALVFDNGESYLRANWLQSSTFDFTFDFTFGSFPESMELRLQPTQRVQSTILYADEWTLDIVPTDGVNGILRLTIDGNQIETNDFPFFNDEYSQIYVSKEVSGSTDTYTVRAAQGFQQRIRASQVATFSTGSTSSWEQGTDIFIGGAVTGGLGTLPSSPFYGNLDEFRMWRNSLDEETFFNHTLSPESIDGNTLRAFTEDLLIRFDFEVPKNRTLGADTDIMNVAPNFEYQENGTAFLFDDKPDYPYSHIVYKRDITAKVPSIGYGFTDKTRLEDISLVSTLSYRDRATRKSFDRAPVDSNRLGIFLSPIKEVNFDIIKKFGTKFRIDDYIGDPADEYNREYSGLKEIRDYYFSLVDLNIQEYVQLVQYIDSTLFDALEKMIPARVQLSKGLLFENHFLQRSKVDWTKPTGSNINEVAEINAVEEIIPTAENLILNAIIENVDDRELEADSLALEAFIDEKPEDKLEVEFTNLEALINEPLNEDLTGEFKTLEAIVDADFGATVAGEAEALGSFTKVGLGGQESPFVEGFGLFGDPEFPGFVIRNRLRDDGSLVKERVFVEVIEELNVFTKKSRNYLEGNERITKELAVSESIFRLNVRPAFDSTGSLQQPTPVGGDIVNVTPITGYLPGHYKFTGDRTTGLERSYYKGSRNTSATTLDGAPSVETFVTNPNVLRVSNAGRGSGEPILKVDDSD